MAVMVEGVEAGRESSGMICGLVAVGFLEFGGVVVVDFPSSCVCELGKLGAWARKQGRHHAKKTRKDQRPLYR